MDNGYNILCIDDELSILKALQKVLQEPPYKVIIAQDASAGLEILNREFIDIIISDYKMPGMNGIEFLKKAKTIVPNAVRIMLTGYSDIDVTIKAINEGEIHKYITKPWDNYELLSMIEEAIDKKRNENMPYVMSTPELEREFRNIRRVLETTNFSTIKALSKAIELKDVYTKGHCERVTEYALMIAQSIGLDSQQIANIKFAGILHDIGKIGVPSEILNKPGQLTPEERKVIERHPVDGANITSEIDFLSTASRMILEHHERVDGTGYPDRKKYGEILIESKIICIADVYDALISDRAYRPAMPVEKARAILIAEKGKMFEPYIVDHFLYKVLDA